MPRLTPGVDPGGAQIQTVLLRGDKVARSAGVPTPPSGADAAVAAITASSKASPTAAAAPPAAPGAAGTVGHSPNVPGFETDPVPLGPEVSRALGGIEVKLDNDVRVAVLGEWKRGAGRPYRDLLGVFVGTGVGGGLILEGALREGSGAAGEIGHTIVKEGGRRCGCGQRGCLEAYAGRARIEATARRWQERGRPTKLFDIMRRK